MLKFIVLTFSLFGLFVQCSTKSATETAMPTNSDEVVFPVDGKLKKVKKSDEEWKLQLSDLDYYVLREKGTEKPFTSELLENKGNGIYTCKGCRLPLFSSGTKFKSGTGWPSFYMPINRRYITESTDYDVGYARTELTCTRCEGHLGHVFPDGPEPTGQRYCINGASLEFVVE